LAHALGSGKRLGRPAIHPTPGSEDRICNESIVDAGPEEQAGLRVRAGQFLQYGHQNADAGIKKYLLRALEKRPDEINSFKTVPEVRTYGEMITPFADIQFMLGGLASG
jgi:hypothetical protein